MRAHPRPRVYTATVRVLRDGYRRSYQGVAIRGLDIVGCSHAHPDQAAAECCGAVLAEKCNLDLDRRRDELNKRALVIDLRDRIRTTAS